jgi:hypothetical protein
MTSECFKEQIDRAVRLAQRELTEDPGEMWPRLMAFGANGKLTWTQIDPAYMADRKSKNLIGAMIVKACFESSVAVMLSDGYGNMTPPEGKTFDDMPRNFGAWPPSLIREALLVFVNAIGMKGYALCYGYTRDGKNRRVFAAGPGPAFGRMITARFCYDLTNATEESATLDALLRGRHGVVESNA